ncbi:MAG TPA: preprotein translocase subunit SecY [Thermoplasmata archaeon]|nr:preprotein translocase subunit SecY [Thermoplasmata archaeon]
MADDEIPRDYRWGLPLLVAAVLLLGLYWFWDRPTPIGFGLAVAAVAAILTLFFLGLSYDGPKSKLYGLKPVTGRMPAIAQPKGHVQFRTKMFWTVGILLLYFLLTNIYLYGVDQTSVIDLFQSYRAILAGAQGTLMHLGIGPIVTGSIIMQLFTGAKIINLDLTNDEDKGTYQGTQKVMVLAMIFVEAIPQVYGYLSPSASLVSSLGVASPGNGLLLADAVIVAQLVFGSYLVFLMDEVVSKWGIGSGISLFIAAGVSQQIVQGTLNWLPSGPGGVSMNNPPSGTIPKAFFFFTHDNAQQMASGGWEQVLLHSPNPVVALVGTALIFFLVAWTESTRIELPLSHAEARGARGRYPLRLIYASNIPVILMAALLANVSMFSILLWNNAALSHFPVLGHQWWIGSYAASPQQATAMGVSQTTPLTGGAYYLSTVNGLESWLLPLLNSQVYGGFLVHHAWWQDLAHVVIYFSVLVTGSIIFARFWIQTTNMGPEAVARQIEASGMQIPGFRREPRVLRRVLERYIPVITIISGAAVGALAAGADLIGTVGNASGTGVLLTVGIIINLYQAMGREQAMEMNPLLRRFLGGES